MVFQDSVLVDGRTHMLGRLASIIAKELLCGQKVVVVRCEQLCVSGSLVRNKVKFTAFLKKRTNTNPKQGPIHYRSPARMLWRTVRGMLPHKTHRWQQEPPRPSRCQDIKGATNCTDHEALGVHTCEWCASEQVWQNAGTAYAWPEDDVEAVASKPSVGVAFSGGGTRSYAASVGVAQALEALGLLSKIKYMSGVSGGSWFVSALAYDQSDDEAALLCPHRGGNGARHARRPYAPPSNLTLEYLADLPAGCMADATTYNFIGEVVAKAAGDIFDKEELFSTVWEEVVDEAIFRPRGIASKSRAALSAKAAEDARARSPNLAAYPFVWPRRLDAVPFPISSGTLLGPVALAPYARHNRSFTIVQHTPIYSGNPYTSTVTYNSQDGCDDDDHCVTATDAVRVGGLFSAYAYGADVPLRNGSLAPGQRSGELAVLAPKDGATVQRAAAMSSMAPAAWFANESPELLGVTLSEEYAYAPDAAEWDPAARVPTASDIDANIPALFGIVVEDAPSVIDVAVGTDYSSIQVFRCVEINQWNGRVQQNFKPL
ncbi:hypothetical protein JL721_12257 [Aureococcus anophagefferens]|nr:hypothetical protein JL721_12257 [Aureococcus anophagefferens]